MSERQSGFGSTVVRAALSPWAIVALVTIGWGPMFIAELVRTSRPDLDASYGPQAFGMVWLRVTFLCTSLAVVFLLIYLVRLIFSATRGKGSRGGR
jgi:hypothetical protein